MNENESLHAWERGSVGTGLHGAFCFSSLFMWIKGGRGDTAFHHHFPIIVVPQGVGSFRGEGGASL